MIEKEKSIIWIRGFNHKTTRDATFDLYNNFKPSELNEWVNDLWNKFSNIYIIKCSPFKIDERKDTKDIYDILKRYENKAEWRPIEILIWEYNQDTINQAIQKTEELKKQFEWIRIEVREPYKYMHIIWYFWWTSWRTIQEVIKHFKSSFKNKIKTITPNDLKH